MILNFVNRKAIFNMNNGEYCGEIIRVEKSKQRQKILDKPIWDSEDYHTKYYNTNENEAKLSEPVSIN